MANTTISPNMGLPVPTVGEDPAPDWATNVNASLSIIDGHGHTPGSGVQITPTAININANLPFNNENATTVRSVRFYPQTVALPGATDLGCLFELGVDLYYIDGAGNVVRITQSGSVTGATGTITGLPSGTASAAFAGGTFSWQSATNTPAAMSFGPFTMAQQLASGKSITISVSGSQAANYVLTMPVALPSGQSAIVSDASGNLSFLSLTSTTGTFVATFTQSGGYSQATTIRYNRVNNLVTLRIPVFQGTTTAAAPLDSGATDLPAAIRPANIQRFPIQVSEVVTNTTPGQLEIQTAGQMRIFKNPNDHNFSSGSANTGLGLPADNDISATVTYSLT